MKRKIKQMMACLLTFVMMISLLQISVPIANAAEENGVFFGEPAEIQNEVGKFYFPNLQVIGNDIKSITIQFSSAIKNGDELLVDESKLGSKIVKYSRSAESYLILNARDASTTISASEWADAIKNAVTVKVVDSYDARTVTAMVSNEIQNSVVMYNYYNGHYYEVVDEATTWKQAFEASRNKKYKGSTGYLVNITTKQENDFVYSICGVTTWIGTTCASDVAIGDNILNVDESTFQTNTKGKTLEQLYGYKTTGSVYPHYWFYLDGDEAGKMMCYNTERYTDHVTMTEKGTTVSVNGNTVYGAMEESDYNNWANSDNWPYNSNYDGINPTTYLHEPNEMGQEFYMCMYGKTEVLDRGWQLPAMWNDFADNDSSVKSYVIEYGKKSEPFTEEKPTEVVINGDHVIKANNFIISVGDAQKASADDVKKYSNAYAVSESGAQDVTDRITVDNEDIQRLNQVTAPGIVPGITLNHPEEDDTLDVTAIVVDKTYTGPQQKVTIGANHITITVEEAKQLTKDKVIELSNPQATVNGILVSQDDIELGDEGYNRIQPQVGVYPITFVYGGYDGVRVEVDVRVIGDEEEYPKLDVHDFIVSVEDAQKANANDIIDYTDATPYYDEDNEDTIDRVSVPSSEVNKLTSVDSPAIVSGIELSYTPSTGTSTKTEPVTAYVVEKTNDNANKDGYPTIGANDFTISVEQAEEFLEEYTSFDEKQESANLFKKISGVIASSITGTIVPGQSKAITINNTTLKAEKGIYKMTFGYNNETVTVNVTVVDDGTNNGPKIDKGNVAASDFTYEYINGKHPGNHLSADDAKDYSDADATTALGIPVDAVPDANQLKKINDAIDEGKTGKYPLTFTNAEDPDVSITITVTLKQVDPCIIADDIIVPTDKVPVDDNDIKEEADVDVTTPEGERKGPENVDVKDKGDLPTIADKKEPGVTEVTFEDTDPDGEQAPDRKITVTVVDEVNGPKQTEDGTELITIGANHYSITIAQAEAWINSGKKATDMATVFKALANASATEKPVDGSDGANLIDKDWINIANDTIVAENGIYRMTFEYKGAEVTVNVTVKDDGVTDSTGTPINPNVIPTVNLTGNDFCVPAKGTPLDKTSFMDKGDVTAQKTDGSKIPASDITVDPTDLAKVNDAISKGEKGDYPVKVTTNGVQTIVTVTVTDVAEDKPYTGPDGTTMVDTIAANNFTIGIEDYDKINNNVTNVVILSNAQAYDVDTKTPVKITSVDTSQVQNMPGTYPVTLTTEHGTSTTINVTINNDWKTIGDVDKAGEANKTTDTTNNVTAVPNTPTPADTPADTIGVDKVYEISNPTNVTQDLDIGRTVNKVNLDGTDLSASQYTVKNNVLTIKSAALASKKPGTYPVVITYADGSKKTFNIIVVEYDSKQVITKVPILKLNKNIGVGNKFTLNLVGISKTAVTQYKSSNKKVATISNKGVITGKKKGKCVITANVIQNGSYYKVRVNLKVKKAMMIYNLKKAALSKKSGDLPEFNVYKRIFKGKKSTLKFTNVEKNAKITYTTKNKKIATVTKKGVIKGKKKGFTVVTAKIVQNGKTYITRIFVRVDDNTKNKQNKKYLKENYGKKKK